MNNNITVCILGAGTPSAISIACLVHSFNLRGQLHKLRIKCIHDPKIPTLTVGESISPAVTEKFCDALNIKLSDVLDQVDGTHRHGSIISYENDSSKTFKIKYKDGVFGMHANSEKLSQFVINELARQYPSVMSIHHDNVSDIVQDINSAQVHCISGDVHICDYVIDSRGTPTNSELESDDYVFSDFETVNSIIVYPDFTKYNEQYTQSTFHLNGWMFGVPLQHRKGFGYMFNKDITPIEEAQDHFKKLVPQVDLDKTRQFNWRHYYKKHCMDGRVLFTGNKLYFYEPSMGNPVQHFLGISNTFAEKIMDTNTEGWTPWGSFIDIGRYINFINEIYMNKIQDLVAFNYIGNSADSNFWKKISWSANNRLKKSKDFKIFANNVINKKIYSSFWTHDPDIMRTYVEGYKIDLRRFT